MYQIEVKTRFRAGHRLMPPYKGLCNNVHGEGYEVTVIIAGPDLQEDDTLLDFSKVRKFLKEWIDNNWDHAYIHRVDDPIGNILSKEGLRTFALKRNPTCEALCEYLHGIVTGWLSTFEKSEVEVNMYDISVGMQESFDDAIAWYFV